MSQMTQAANACTPNGQDLAQQLHVKVTVISETEMCTLRCSMYARRRSCGQCMHAAGYVGALYAKIPQSYYNLRSTSILLRASITSRILINNNKHMYY